MATPPKPIKTQDVGGRPSKFHTRLLPHARKLAKTGATEVEIADLLGINWSTYIDWQSRYPRFSNALELGKKQANKRVARALYHRAVGYTHDSVRVFNDKGEPLIVPIREHVPPDINAVKFFLTNRDPENWQDRSSLDMTGSVSIVAQTLSAAKQRVLQAKASPPTLDASDTCELSADPAGADEAEG